MNNSFSSLAILIPAFNPNQNIIDLVLDLSYFKWNEIIVINDGSSNESQIFFDNLNDFDNVHILTHQSNKGKGAALKTGIDYLNSKNTKLDGLITVDSDGQHLVKDIEKIAREVKNRKNDVIFGVRLFDESIPFRSKFGNKITKHLLYIFNGISLTDTQTGLRYLPVSIFDELLKLPGNKYEFELECIFTIKKLGYNITQIKIKTVYINGNKDSHFRPLIDSARIYLVFTRFCLTSFLSFALDMTLFAFFLSYLESILYATFIARIISGIFNFYLNRNFTFKVNKKNNLVKESIGYVVLWSTLLILSGLIVSSLQGSPAYLIIPFKIIVDLILFFVAFYVQKNIIFNTK
jgi:glycosyltransferase involved in cell wall biosynthesis